MKNSGNRQKRQPAATTDKKGTVTPVESSNKIEKLTGTTNPELQRHFVDQIFETMWLPKGISREETEARTRSIVAMLDGIRPADEMEGMLAVQMVTTHNAAMECFRRAMLDIQTFDGRDLNMKYATKLLSIYARQLEALNKHRGKGQQKVTVEHVNVSSGGQAIVGHVETGSRSESSDHRTNQSHIDPDDR